ncbi:MAG TPA: LuxR C-terminal-related transcriptional regulator [Methylomirabilota bacterium]|jgi:DNA-binding NarL/FixJ family response regulator
MTFRPGRLTTGRISGLTRREREVIDLLTRGVRNREIAQQLSISERTVKAHLTHIYLKLGVSNRLQLAISTLRANTKVQ